jgi:hypothetical protein
MHDALPGICGERLEAPVWPAADPHVRWCGRGVAGITGYPRSRHTMTSIFSTVSVAGSCHGCAPALSTIMAVMVTMFTISLVLE